MQVMILRTRVLIFHSLVHMTMTVATTEASNSHMRANTRRLTQFSCELPLNALKKPGIIIRITANRHSGQRREHLRGGHGSLVARVPFCNV